MAWDAINTIPAMHGKSLALREIFAKAANAALEKGQTEEEAKFSGMNAVRIHEKKHQAPKAMPPKVPAHVQAVRSFTEPYNMVSKAIEPLSTPTIKAVDFDAQGHLVILMSDGNKIVTKGKAAENHINQSVGVSVNPVFDYVQLNTTANLTEEDFTAGMLTWNEVEDCLDVVQNDGTRLQTGLENYIIVRNDTNYTLMNGEAVRFENVADTDSPTVVPMIADGTVEPLYLVGILTNPIPAGGTGRATVFGKVRNIDTTGTSCGEIWAVGDLLWVHPTQAGKLTKVRPSTPNVAIAVAVVVKHGITDGALLVRPTLFPHLFYGNLSSTTTQTPVLIDTPYPIHFEHLDESSGITVSNSHIIVQNAGLYVFDFRLQVMSANASQKNIYIWARKNGVDIPRSATKITITGNNVEAAPSWSFTVPMKAGNYFELMYACDSTAIAINAPEPTSFCPATPSATMNIKQLNL